MTNRFVCTKYMYIHMYAVYVCKCLKLANLKILRGPRKMMAGFPLAAIMWAKKLTLTMTRSNLYTMEGM